MTEAILTADHVEAVVKDCLYKPEELTGSETPEGAVIVEGLVQSYGFHPDRLQSHAEGIFAMLKELPSEFMKSQGGGMSFLQACNNKDGVQWTGLHRTMESLFCLGLAIGKVEYLFPRPMWGSLPGSVPYLVVLDEEE